MNIYLTQADINETIRLGIISVSKKLNIEDIDWKSSNELYEEIRLSGHPYFSLLDNYLINYMAWVTFIIDNKDREEFNYDETEKLSKLIENRNSTRLNLKKAIMA